MQAQSSPKATTCSLQCLHQSISAFSFRSFRYPFANSAMTRIGCNGTILHCMSANGGFWEACAPHQLLLSRETWASWVHVRIAAPTRQDQGFFTSRLFGETLKPLKYSTTRQVHPCFRWQNAGVALNSSHSFQKHFISLWLPWRLPSAPMSHQMLSWQQCRQPMKNPSRAHGNLQEPILFHSVGAAQP